MTGGFKQIKQFLRAENGAAAVEYAAVMCLVILVCIGSMQALGDVLRDTVQQTGRAASGRTVRMATSASTPGTNAGNTQASSGQGSSGNSGSGHGSSGNSGCGHGSSGNSGSGSIPTSGINLTSGLNLPPGTGNLLNP